MLRGLASPLSGQVTSGPCQQVAGFGVIVDGSVAFFGVLTFFAIAIGVDAIAVVICGLCLILVVCNCGYGLWTQLRLLLWL